MTENARQLEGWAFNRKVRTKAGELAWGFFTDRKVAEREAARMSTVLEPCHIVSATLIMPPANPQEGAAEGEGQN